MDELCLMRLQWIVFHIDTPSQIEPFPVNPCLHVQLYEPSVLVQSAFSSQGLGSNEHSSKSGMMKGRSNLHILKSESVFIARTNFKKGVFQFQTDNVKNIFTFKYLYKTVHLHQILVYKHSCKNRQCWCNQRSRHTDWNPQNTHRYLMW